MSDEPRRHDSPGGPDPVRMPTAVAYLVVVFSPLLLFFAFGLLAFLDHRPSCGEIGCNMSGPEEAIVSAIIIGIPAALIQIALGCGVLALLRLWKAYRKLPIAVQGLIPSTPIILLAFRVLFSSP